MTVDIYAPTPQDGLSLTELALYHLIMDYRASLGLPPVPISGALTLVAGRHTLDTVENIWRPDLVLPAGANLHSWSDAPYYSDHRDPQVMWEAPERLGSGYPGYGFEISAAGYSSIAAALTGWQNSAGHNAVIVNSGAWADMDWQAIGIGVQMSNEAGLDYNGMVYHVWFGTLPDPAGSPPILGTGGADNIRGTAFADTIRAQDGQDTLNGGTGDDFLFGGATAADLRDVVYGGDGHDRIDGGYGNDELNGGNDNDTVSGGIGADTLIGNDGNDLLAGMGGGDLLYGNGGNDTLNGGFGYDRLNGGAGADSFYHQGVADHGSDWVQDYSAAEGDVLSVGIAGATASQFQVNFAVTPGAGSAAVAEAFIIYKPTGQILWALVDGGDDSSINLRIAGQTFDLLA